MLQALLISLALAGSHSVLHPANADLYLELSAPKELLAARARAPWSRLFADPDMQKLGALLEGFHVPLAEIVATARPEELVGEQSPLRQLQQASFSISGLDRLAQAADLERVEFEGVLDFTDAAAAASALHLAESSKFLVACDETSLASRCKFGEHECALRWFRGAAADMPAALASAGGKAAQRTAENGRIWIAQDGARLYVGAMATTPESAAARSNGSAPGLPEESKLFAGAESFSPSSGTPIYRLWADLELPQLAQGSTLAGLDDEQRSLARWILPLVLPHAGAKGSWRVEMRGERFVSEAVFQRYPGFESKSIGLAPVDPAAARFVPKEAVGAWVTSVDPKLFESELRSTILASLAKPRAAVRGSEGNASNAENDAGAELARKAAELAKDLPPLSDGLGTQAAFYLLPINSLQAFLPRAFLAVELKDKAKFEAALETWITKLGGLDPRLKIANKPYRKLTCVTLSTGKDDEEAAAKAGPLGAMAPDMNPSPTLVVFEDRVLFGVKKAYVQSETRRIADGKSTEVHPFASDGRIPKDCFEASTMDWGGFFGKLLDVVKQLVPMAAGMMGPNAPQIDATALPGSATLARYFKPTNSWSKRLADGRVYTFSESSFGPETPLEMGAFAAAAFSVVSKKGFGAPPATAQPAEPETATDPRDDPALKSIASMLAVKTGIAVYRSQKNKLPEKLEDLLQPTDSFPGGFLAPEKSVPLDGWGHALVFKPDGDGRKFRLYSCGADGKDDGGTNDDVLVP